jgi:membrane associated rhomboid family serine protease
MTNPFPTIAEHTRSLRASTVLAFTTVVLFILDASMPQFTSGLQLSAARVPVASISLLTFLFAASTVTDAILAAVILVYFCRDLEKNLGTGKFLLLYLSGSLAGAGAQLLGASRLPVAGGAAAAIGALVVYSYLWPLNRVVVLGTIPVGPRQLLMITVGYRFLWGFGMTGPGAGTALSLLGGAAMGVLFCGWLSHTSAASKYRRALRTALVGDAASWSGFDVNSVPRDGLHSVTLEELDRVLAKAKDKGIRSLTDEERAFVHRLRQRAQAETAPATAGVA